MTLTTTEFIHHYKTNRKLG